MASTRHTSSQRVSRRRPVPAPIVSPDDEILAEVMQERPPATASASNLRRAGDARAYEGSSAAATAWVPTPQGVRRPVPAPAEQPPDDEECARRLQNEFDREAAAKAERTRFQCPLCLEVASYDSSVELDCLHRTCAQCFHSYLEVKIREKLVTPEELRCPMPDCHCEVTVPQVEGATKGTPLWDRFLASRAELWQPSGKDGDRLYECPAPGCSARFLLGRTAASLASRPVRCPECRAEFCRECGLQHPGVPCEAYRTWRKENDNAEQEFEALVLREKWQRCPKCQAACERQQGCNFMTCHSAKCRGTVYFCYVCGKELQHSEHFSHFPHGLFVNACESVDNRPETPVQPSRRRQRPDVDLPWLAQTLEEFRGWVQGAR